MASKFHDFDAQFAEMKHETVDFKIFGKKYKIRKEIPAVIPLEMARLEKSETLDNQVLFKAARLIFGEKNLSEIAAHEGFSVQMLTEMIKWAFEAINGKVDHDEPEELTEDDFDNAPKRKN